MASSASSLVANDLRAADTPAMVGALSSHRTKNGMGAPNSGMCPSRGNEAGLDSRAGTMDGEPTFRGAMTDAGSATMYRPSDTRMLLPESENQAAGRHYTTRPLS